MESPAIPSNEVERLEALYRYQISTLPEKAYNDIIHLAATIFNVPISLISLVDEDKCWFKAKMGIDHSQTSRKSTYAAHAINQPSEVMVIEDVLKDERFFDSPLALQDPPVRFYAGTPLVTPDGFAIGTLCIIDKVPRNLSKDQIQTLQILAKQIINQLELNLKKGEVDRLSDKLQYANQDLKNFSHAVAHDLRAPVKNIEGLLGLLKGEYQFDSLGNELINGLKTASERMDSVIMDIWNLSKINFTTLQNCSIDFSKLCNTVLNSITPKGKYSFQIQEGMRAMGDPMLLATLVENLLSNAIKSSSQKDNPIIVIGQKNQDNQVVYFIQDNGIGLANEEIESIFKPFHKVDTTNNLEVTGVGLAVVKKVINRHGGKIWVQSTPKKGATFYFTLS